MVFVVDTNRRPLSPCRPARARQLLARGRAAVLYRYPFTIVLTRSVPDAQPAPLRLKLDPGSRTTGLALVDDRTGNVVFAAEITHRGLAVRGLLDSRRALRRGRRHRQTRYRPKRFENRTRPAGWLAPSLESRVANALTWVRRLRRVAPMGALAVEFARFDTQALVTPEIAGFEYQQGTLAGYEVREYLLEKWGRRCGYCHAEDVPLQIEHIVPRGKGGTNRVSNLTLACEPCNTAKGTRDVREFLAHDPERLARVLAQAQAPLRDAAAVNTTRWRLYERLQALGLPVEVGTGGRTKWNRTRLGLAKSHWADAACVGASTPDRLRGLETLRVLTIRAVGHGSRQMCRMDRYGFPRTGAKGPRVVQGMRTGDTARLTQPTGKYRGAHLGTVAVRRTGMFDLATTFGGKRQKITAPAARFTVLHRADGYAYAT